jgi:hypothetical protein
MPFRYRILGLTGADRTDPAALLTRITGTAGTALATQAFQQWGEVVAHLAKAGVQTLLVQDGVRDPDFLEEYEAFYSKQMRDLSRLCVRVHAFGKPLPGAGETSDRAAVLDFVDAAAAEPTSYLGFVTLRPLRHARVGASIFVDTPDLPSLCKDVFPVHIAGATFKVTGTPYLQQDNAVGACAQASMWMALRTLRRRAGNNAYSPAQLTVAATKYFSTNRVFPGRKGLIVEQMLTAIRESNHDPLVIPVGEKDKLSDPEKVVGSARPYLESGLPVITILYQPTTGGHAVVAIGLSQKPATKKFLPPSLTIHNDNQGPYRELPSAVVPKGSHEYALEQAISLIVPLPDGVFMSAAEAEPQAVAALTFWVPSFLRNPAQPGTPVPLGKLTLRTYLCTRHAFRKWARSAEDLDVAAKEIYRSSEMPRLVWVCEIHDTAVFKPTDLSIKSRVGEIVLDASADAMHGDALVFVRLTDAMLTVPTTSPGLLIVDNGALLALQSGGAGTGLATPWDVD